MATEEGEGHRVSPTAGRFAFLVKRSDLHGGASAECFLETGLGPLDGPQGPTFPQLDAALDWIGTSLSVPPEPRLRSTS